MESMKCKICGGTLEPLSNGDFKCDSCGTVVKKEVSEEKARAGLAESADTAKELRESGNFASAYLIYENILTKKPQDAEARWNLVLCRYGVRYQFDELTGEELPTVNRMRYDSILEDPDYQAALTYAGEDEKRSYMQAARAIANIQKRYLAIAEKEEPYDVFISFKAENEDGTRSRDSVIGQEIYNHLTEHGLRVFYSRITLENKGGEEFEPYIFSALNTAKVMLLVGTKREHVLAPWVANEWQRFVDLMRDKKDKSLLPVYEGMELSQFPEEIPTREAVNYAEQGALQELTQGVLSITGKGVLVDAENSRASIAKLTEGLRQAVERGEQNQARELAGAVLDLDAENSDAYFYLLLALFKVKKATELSDVEEPWPENRYYQRALKYADPARRQLLEAVRQRREMRLEEERKNRAQKAEEERRAKKISDAVSAGKELLEKKEYQEAFNILIRGAAGDPEGDKLIEISRKGIEATELLADKNFLDNMLKQDHGKEYLKMDQLALREYNAFDGSAILQIVIFIAGIAAFVLAWIVGNSTDTSSRADGILDYIWLFLGPILMVLLLIAGIGGIAAGLVNLIRALRGKQIKKAYSKHMANVIEPLRNAAWENIRKKYVPYLGEEMFRKRP